MKKKTLGDIFGDIMDSHWKRTLFGAAITAIGVLLSGILLPVAADFLIIGVTCVLSVFRTTKVKYVTTLFVKINEDKTVPFSVLKKEHYAFMPVVPFFSLFFWVPYRVEYYLIKNIDMSVRRPRERMADFYTDVPGLYNIRKISAGELKRIKYDPSIVASIYTSELSSDYSAFCEAVKPFVDNGLIVEDFHTPDYSIFTYCENVTVKLLFAYSGSAESQVGLIIPTEKIAEMMKNPSFSLSMIYMNPGDEISYLPLDKVTLERLLRNKKSDPVIDDVHNTEYKTDNSTEQAIRDVNNQKEKLTHGVIVSAINKKLNNKIAFGGLLIFLSIYGFLGAIAGFVSGLIPLGIIGTVLGPALLYYGIRRIVRANRVGNDAKAGKYSVKLLKCTMEKQLGDDDDMSITHVYIFEDGTKITHDIGNIPMGIGDYAYFVYYGEKKPVLFNALEYYYEG